MGRKEPSVAKNKILYVDDEEVNLTNFRIAFEGDYEVLTALSGAEALSLFHDNKDIALVIADQRMPGMTGVDLLAEVLRTAPDTVRMILTAYRDVDAIIDAVNKGYVYQYILKPWDEGDLRLAMDRAVKMYLLGRENKALLRVIEERNRELLKANQELTETNERLKQHIILRRRAEEEKTGLKAELVRAERLATIGQLAASVAHEINTPLQAIYIDIGILQDEYGDHKKVMDILGVLKRGVDRVRDAVGNLLDLNRPGREPKQAVNMNDVVLESVALERSRLEQDAIKLSLDLAPGLPTINASPQKLTQVLLNLLSNAIEAISGLSRTGQKEGAITVKTVAGDDDIVVSVADTGPGIAEEDLPRLFNCFFTRKKASGMGLGLSICHSIVEEHGGTLTARNLPEGGAVFTLKLPLA
jgi:C4-dicarboxylate-specific signal transduction histidine kinase